MKDRDIVIDIESCLNTIKEADASEDNVGKSGENLVNPSTHAKNAKSEKNEKRFSMSAKKPPKPPRPPRGLSLDAADQKLIKEISELAMIKRARIERMKALKKMKAAKASSGWSSSSGNLIAMLFTVLFCVVIIFQGCHPSRVLPSNTSAVGIISSPSPNGATDGNNIVGIMDQRKSSTGSAHASSGFGSPSFMDLAPGLDNKDLAKKSFY